MVTYPTTIKHIIRVSFEGQAGNRANFYSKSTVWKGLMDTWGDAQNFHGFSGTSLPSYIIATAGSNHGITSDTSPNCCKSPNPGETVTCGVANIYDTITAVGLTYENYAEAQGSTTRHTPGYFYNHSCGSVQDFSAFISNYINGTKTPPSLTWVTPNLCNCCHDCANPVTCGTWVQNTLKIDTLMAKPWFTDGSTVIMLVQDDGGSASASAVCIFCNPLSKGRKSTVNYTHISELSTVMWLLGITGSIGSSSAATAMKDMFGTAPPPTQTLTSVSPAGKTIQINTTQQYIALDQSGNPITTGITWAKVTGVGSLNSAGLYSAGAVVGTATIQATQETISKTTTVTVASSPPPSGILTSVTPSPLTIQVNHMQKFTALDQNGVAITTGITWSKVSGLGGINNTTNPGNYSSGAVAGSAVIKAAQGAISKTVNITITTAPPPSGVAKISMGTNLSTPIVAPFILMPNCYNSSGTLITCPFSGMTYKSTDPTVATISTASNGGLVTTLKAGVTNLTATSGSVTSNALVLTVTPPATGTLASILPPSKTIQINHMQKFTAVDQNGVAITTGITWSRTGVGSINNTTNPGNYSSGTVAGTAVITAKQGTITRTANVTVTLSSPPPATCTYSAIIQKYDTNNNGIIETTELLKAGDDFRNGLITQAQIDEISAYWLNSCTHTTTPKLTSISPSTLTIQINHMQKFTALDQNGVAITTGITWSKVSGVGSINNTTNPGNYSSGAVAGTAVIQASQGATTATATVTVTITVTTAAACPPLGTHVNV